MQTTATQRTLPSEEDDEDEDEEDAGGGEEDDEEDDIVGGGRGPRRSSGEPTPAMQPLKAERTMGEEAEVNKQSLRCLGRSAL